MIRLKRSNVHSLAKLAAVTALIATLMAPQLACHWLALGVIVMHYFWPTRTAPFLLVALMPEVTSYAGTSTIIDASIIVLNVSYVLYFTAYELLYERPHVSCRVATTSINPLALPTKGATV